MEDEKSGEICHQHVKEYNYEQDISYSIFYSSHVVFSKHIHNGNARK
jgi:hypothetical protein